MFACGQDRGFPGKARPAKVPGRNVQGLPPGHDGHGALQQAKPVLRAHGLCRASPIDAGAALASP